MIRTLTICMLLGTAFVLTSCHTNMRFGYQFELSNYSAIEPEKK